MLKGKFACQREPNTKINDRKLRYTDTFTYLGIHIQQNFNFQQHIDIITDKLKKHLATLFTIAKSHSGYTNHSLLLLYNSSHTPLWL